MRQMILFAIILSLIGLIGCEKSETVDKPALEQLDPKNLTSVTIMKDNKSVQITEIKAIESFVQAANAGEYDQGKLDIAPPDYGATVEFNNGNSLTFSFWIEDENTGLFMISGVAGHYRLPEASKNGLLELFQSEIEKSQESSRALFSEWQADQIRWVTMAPPLPKADLVSQPLFPDRDANHIQQLLKWVEQAVPVTEPNLITPKRSNVLEIGLKDGFIGPSNPCLDLYRNCRGGWQSEHPL
ncbi:hypothetical protein AB6A23_23170 [Paenibacillus tarimensis]